jgi:hypothetical protein
MMIYRIVMKKVRKMKIQVKFLLREANINKNSHKFRDKLFVENNYNLNLQKN